jgi:hypothetical protein
VLAGQCRDCYWIATVEDIRTGALNRLWRAMSAYWRGDKNQAHYEAQMAWERATNSGDYRHGGHFDSMLPGWRYRAFYQAPRSKPDVILAAQALQRGANDDGGNPRSQPMTEAGGLPRRSLLSPPAGPRSGMKRQLDPYPYE